MSSFQIIVGSMLGGSEYVAEACEEQLVVLGHEVTVHLQPSFDDIPSKNQTWLFCTSTHGAGDYPDNIQTFASDLENSTIDLSSTQLITIGLGDSSYDTFCFAAVNINKLAKSKGCKEITEPKLFDMSLGIDPESEASEWITSIQDQL